MKCDELKTVCYIDAYSTMPVYCAKEVDEAIDELKREHHRERHEYIDMVAQRKKKLVEQESENRKLKRALWLARAERADDRARIFYFNDLETMLDIDGYSYDSKKKKGCKKFTARLWRIIWLKVERKCRAKAEEYK